MAGVLVKSEIGFDSDVWRDLQTSHQSSLQVEPAPKDRIERRRRKKGDDGDGRRPPKQSNNLDLSQRTAALQQRSKIVATNGLGGFETLLCHNAFTSPERVDLLDIIAATSS